MISVDLDPHLDSKSCTPQCRELAVRSTLGRETPPAVKCEHCGAAPYVACIVVGPRHRLARPLTRFGRFHPSRLEAVA